RQPREGRRRPGGAEHEHHVRHRRDRRPLPAARPALMRFSFRGLRNRWGIAAPKLAVIPHVAWYWRALVVVAVLSVSLVLARWMYDAGRRIAGFDATAAEGELSTLRNRVASLEDELKRLRATNASADSRVQIEKTAQSQLVKQLK